jgi:hypothetical protein
MASTNNAQSPPRTPRRTVEETKILKEEGKQLRQLEETATQVALSVLKSPKSSDTYLKKPAHAQGYSLSKHKPI